MKINSMNSIGGKKDSYLKYILLAILAGIVFYFFFNLVVKLIVFVVGFLIKHWLGSLVAVLAILFLKKKLHRKVRKSVNNYQ